LFGDFGATMVMARLEFGEAITMLRLAGTTLVLIGVREANRRPEKKTFAG
jgi:hypothetical protein